MSDNRRMPGGAKSPGYACCGRGHYPNDGTALKRLFLVLNRAEKEWTMPAREWTQAMAQFAILFGERFTRAVV